VLIQSKAFPGDPLETVSRYRKPRSFFGNRETETRTTRITAPGENCKISVAGAYRLIENMTEFSGFQQSGTLFQARLAHCGRPLYRQAVAAFCAARFQYLATAQCTAACTKPVRSCAFDTAWLECSFHCT